MAYLFCIARKSAAFIAHSAYESAVVFAVDAKREQGSRAGAGDAFARKRTATAGEPPRLFQVNRFFAPSRRTAR